MRHLDGGKEEDQFDNSSDYEAADKTKELFRFVYITMHLMNFKELIQQPQDRKKTLFHAFVLNTCKSKILKNSIFLPQREFLVFNALC